MTAELALSLHCRACGEVIYSARRLYCYECYQEVVWRNVTPAVYWIIYGDSRGWEGETNAPATQATGARAERRPS